MCMRKLECFEVYFYGFEIIKWSDSLSPELIQCQNPTMNRIWKKNRTKNRIQRKNLKTKRNRSKNIRKNRSWLRWLLPLNILLTSYRELYMLLLEKEAEKGRLITLIILMKQISIRVPIMGWSCTWNRPRQAIIMRPDLNFLFKLKSGGGLHEGPCCKVWLVRYQDQYWRSKLYWTQPCKHLHV